MKVALKIAVLLSGVVFTSSLGTLHVAAGQTTARQQPNDYFPPLESAGGWRTLNSREDLRRVAGI
jgi:hypothetical protein